MCPNDAWNERLYIFVFAVYLLVLYTCVLKSQFGHVWLLTSLVCLLKLLYVSTFLRGWRSHSLNPFFILSIVCVYTFFCSFLYGALCPRSCYGSYAIEMSIIIIIVVVVIIIVVVVISIV